MKTILWFTDTFEDLNGIASTLQEITQYALKHKYNIIVVTTTNKKLSTIYNLDLLFNFTLPYYNVLKIKIPKYSNIKNLLKLSPYKIYISTPGPIGLLGKMVAQKSNCKCIGVYHTDFEAQTKYITNNYFITKFMKYYELFFYKLCDEIITPSKEYLDILKTKYKNVSLFSRAVDKEIFYYDKNSKQLLIKKYNIKKTDKIVIYVGRISKDKNIDFLIKVYFTLKDNLYNENIKLLLIGDGPYLKELQKKYKDKDIIFCGNIDRAELKDYYSSADLFLFPSITDTFGMVIIEALACNCPVLVSNIGGPQNTMKSLKLDNHIIKYDNIIKWYLESINILKRKNKINYSNKIYKYFNWKKAIKQIIK